MSDNTESVDQSGGELSTLTQQSSTEKTAQTSPVDAKALAELLKSDKEFLDAVSSQMRSVHDKRTVQHEKKIIGIEETLERFNALKGEGLSDTMAVRIMKLEDAISPVEEPTGQQTKQSTAERVDSNAQQKSGVSDLTIENYAKFLGVDPTGAEYIEMARQSTDKAGLLQKINDYSENKKKTSTASTADTMQINQSSTQNSVEDVDTLTRRLNDLNNDPTSTAKERQEVRDKLKKLIIK